LAIAVLVAGPVLAQAAPPETMARWNAAEGIPLWTGEPPSGGFVKPPERPDAVPDFVTGAATPVG
jgi:hypothetical protein